MKELLIDVAAALAASPLRPGAVYLLGSLPGLPPIAQTVHILSVTAIMSSTVMIDLKVLGLALPSQSTPELVRRVMPWTWWALPCLAASGLLFFLARPSSYAANPVFRMKFALMAPAIVLAFLFQRSIIRDPRFWEASRGRRVSGKLLAAISLVLWTGVVLAGRWIAYADYLFPVE